MWYEQNLYSAITMHYYKSLQKQHVCETHIMVLLNNIIQEESKVRYHGLVMATTNNNIQEEHGYALECETS